MMEEALRAGDVVGGGGRGARDGFGADGIVGVVADSVSPCSIVTESEPHAVSVPVRLRRVDVTTPRIPVCERAVAVVH